jgi:hypothetical protein
VSQSSAFETDTIPADADLGNLYSRMFMTSNRGGCPLAVCSCENVTDEERLQQLQKFYCEKPQPRRGMPYKVGRTENVVHKLLI